MTLGSRLGTLALVALAALPAQAMPWLYLESGSPCATCHVSPQGGGIRNEVGWYTETRTSLIPIKALPESHTLAGGKIWFGADVRVQMARLGRPTEQKVQPDRTLFLMQAQPNVAVAPTDWLTVHGGVNVAAFDRRYAGQTYGEAALQLSPRASLPTVRAGLIQPSIGIRPEDHTMLIRANAADPRRPFIPPGYNELGLELTYHPVSWVQAEAGIFSSYYLSQTVSNLGSPVAWVFRLMFLPQILDWGIHSWAGASGYGSGDFLMVNAFFGVGVKGIVTLMGELAETHWETARKSDSWAVTLGITPRPWIHLAGRAERAYASVVDRRFGSDQFVASIHFVPIPFLEIRPEYRYVRTDAYILGQYTLQLSAYF
jgi:hypothetical protein